FASVGRPGLAGAISKKKSSPPFCGELSASVFFFRRKTTSYGCADAEVLACVVSNNRVPLSSRTLFPQEAITEPCVEFEPSAPSPNPLKPNTPRLFAASCPDEFTPPVASCVLAPAAVLAVEFTVELAVPATSPVVRAAVLAAPLTAPPTGAPTPAR